MEEYHHRSLTIHLESETFLTWNPASGRPSFDLWDAPLIKFCKMENTGLLEGGSAGHPAVNAADPRVRHWQKVGILLAHTMRCLT